VKGLVEETREEKTQDLETKYSQKDSTEVLLLFILCAKKGEPTGPKGKVYFDEVHKFTISFNGWCHSF
jgi:hypothetical protein